jgi:ABC-type dipeptide/oligopeptide/nickel transport system ATPase component
LRQRVQYLLRAVRIPSPEVRMREYPHQMSGGMRQRVVGAIAIAGGPKLIIADEPTTNLDVTIQAQYLEVLKDIQQKSGVALIFVTYNLGIVAKMCDKMAVMYVGKIVEYGAVRDLFRDAKHPYTHALLGSMPKLETHRRTAAGQGWEVGPGSRRNAPRKSPTIAILVRIGRRNAGSSISTQGNSMLAPLLELENLQKYFPVSTGMLLRRKIGWPPSW